MVDAAGNPAARSAPGFGGFPERATDFFAGLEADNSREYFASHKEIFERDVRQPMAALVESLPERFQPFKAFRINRDVRFSADKSPYKTQHGAAHEVGGTVYYVHVDSGGLMAACGAYMMAPDQIDRYRQAVDADDSGAELVQILAELDRQEFDVGHGMSTPLKTAPRGYPKDHPRVDLLRQKAVSAHRRLSGPEISDAAAVRDFVIGTFEACARMNVWIGAHVGPTQLEMPRR